MAPAFFSLLTRDLLKTSCSPPKGLNFFVDIINAQGHQRRWWKYFPIIGISEIRVWARSAGPQCSVLPWENQPDSFCNLSDRSDQKSTGLNSEQNNRPVRWWFHLIIKCWQKKWSRWRECYQLHALKERKWERLLNSGRVLKRHQGATKENTKLQPNLQMRYKLPFSWSQVWNKTKLG